MKKALLIILLFIVLQGLFGIASTLLASYFANVYHPTPEQYNSIYNWILGLSLFLSNASMIIAVHFLLRTGTDKPTAYLKAPRWSDLPLTFATLITLIFFVNGLTELLQAPDFIETALEGMIHNPLCLLTIVVVGPMAEEVCFRRGVLGLLLEDKKTTRYALPLSALIFALIHLNPAQMPGAFILGLFLGWLYQRTKSLTLPILCHIFNNGLSVLLGILLGTDVKLSEAFSNQLSFYIALTLSALLAALFFRLLKNKTTSAK